MKKLLLAGAALAVCVPAQNRLGTFDNTGTTYASRGIGAGNNNPVTLFVRIDKERYAGWTTGVQSGTRELTGLNFVMQDQELASSDTFNLVVYGESTTQPNHPAVASPLSLTGNFILPTGGSGPGAYNASANFATPITVPATSDVFVALRLNAGWTYSGGNPINGLSVWDIRSAATPAGPTIDVPGRGRPTNPFDEGTFGGYYVPSPLTGPAYLTTVAVMFKIQPILPIAGGVATAVTNQVIHPESGANSVAGFTVQAPGAGTASMLSGLFPDAANPPLNAGRADEIGMIYINTPSDVPPGSPVFFLIDLGVFSNEIQLAGFLPGSTGVTCLNIASAQTLALGFMGTGVCSHTATFPPAGRSLLTGTSWMQQAVGFNTSTLAGHAGPCTRQQM